MGQVLVADPMSIWYLTGYWNVPYERFYALYLARDAEARTTQATLFCNRLFPDASQTGARIVTFDDTEDPVALVAEATRHGEPLGVDKVLAARWLLPLMDARVASEFHLGSPAVDDARSIKDARELDLMRAASATNDQPWPGCAPSCTRASRSTRSQAAFSPSTAAWVRRTTASRPS